MNTATDKDVVQGGALAPVGTALVKADTQTAVAIPTDVNDLLASEPGEKQDAGGKDMAIPFIALLQKGSPQVDDSSGKYIPGAKQGFALNTVTNEVFNTRDGPLEVIEVAFAKRFVEWVPRDSGGGFVGQHDPSAPIVATAVPGAKGRFLQLPNGNQLVETGYHYVILVTDDGPQWAVIGMSSTQLKTSRKWNTMIQTATVPTSTGPKGAKRFAYTYNLKSKSDSNEFGTWFSWDITKGERVTDIGLVQMAIAYRNAVESGLVQTTPPSPDGADPAGNNAGSGADKDVPF